MTKDDIVRMAQEAGLHLATDRSWMPIIGIEYAEKLIAIAAAAERRIILDAINEIIGSEEMRHPMFSDGHDYSLQCMKMFIHARGQT